MERNEKKNNQNNIFIEVTCSNDYVYNNVYLKTLQINKIINPWHGFGGWAS